MSIVKIIFPKVNDSEKRNSDSGESETLATHQQNQQMLYNNHIVEMRLFHIDWVDRFRDWKRSGCSKNYLGGFALTLAAIAGNKTIAGKSYIYPLFPLNLSQLKKRFLRLRLKEETEGK